MGYKDVITKGYKLLAFNINSWKRLIVIFLGNWIRAPFFKLCWKAFNESWNWAVWHDIRKSTSVIIMQINSRGIPKPAARSRRNGCHPSSVSLSVKNLFTKKEAGIQTLKMYLLNLLNEPQHLAEIKAPKLLKTSKQRGNKFTRTKAQKQQTKTPRKQTKCTRKMSTSVFQCQG